MNLWVIRIFFLSLCTAAGYAVSQYRPEIIDGGWYGLVIGFGLGGLLIGIDHAIKGFSLRAFSAATFGLGLGSVVAWLVDRSELFIWADAKTGWVIRLGLFLSFGYLGIILAMRSNKEDFSLIIPYVRFKAQNLSENLVVLDTSIIIDGRIADLVEARFVEGVLVVPKFVLRELQFIADSEDPVRRARGRRGLEMLARLQQDPRIEVKVHEADVPEEREVDAKLLLLTRKLGARLFTNDHNLAAIAELQSIPCVNLHRLALALKPALVPGEVVNLRLTREGREKGQAIGYLGDGTMMVVNHAQAHIGQQVPVQITSLVQTGAGVIVFGELQRARAA
ncbi:MAG TPA: PIN domain-containing protein [Methylomirabilota bacterium]|nr:PIN domain-containing protein [Methylomirabilota bacterium]